MPEHARVVLESWSQSQVSASGWAVLVVSLLITVVWLAYVYR